MRTQFASDNTAPMSPGCLEAFKQASCGNVPSYGNDLFTAQASDAIREYFQTDCEVFFVFNGTAANSLALAHLCQSYHSVICHEKAHIETDECGAPEFFSNGTKILAVSGAEGRITPEVLRQTALKRSDIHFPKPRVLSLTQASELGTVYHPGDLETLCAAAHELGLKVHVDGARFANACDYLNVAPADISWKVGVDVLSLGGTKNGLPLGEAVVFFDRRLAYEFDYRCKQAGQLASKMRYLSAPWHHMLKSGEFAANAHHANSMADLLYQSLCAVPGIIPLYPRQANAVFVSLSEKCIKHLRARGWVFYSFIGGQGVRLMCSWATLAEDIKDFVQDVIEGTNGN